MEKRGKREGEQSCLPRIFRLNVRDIRSVARREDPLQTRGKKGIGGRVDATISLLFAQCLPSSQMEKRKEENLSSKFLRLKTQSIPCFQAMDNILRFIAKSAS